MRAMTFKEIEVSTIEQYIESDEHAIEQKVDGTRCMVKVVVHPGAGSTEMHFLARNGAPLKHTAATQHLDSIEGALQPHFTRPGIYFLDGEVMIDTGEFIAFDLPSVEIEGRMVVRPEMPYWERRQSLSALLHGVERPVRTLAMHTTPKAKREVFEMVKSQGGEGVMVKHLGGLYEEGKRVKHSVKVKFIKTADVVVTKVVRDRNEAGREIGNITFGVYDEVGEFFTVGRCSVIGKPEVKAGDVIEVAYLYRGPGAKGGLVQPRMLTVREDKRDIECTVHQFPTYSKAVL